MTKAKKFDLEKYIEYICKKAKIDPSREVLRDCLEPVDPPECPGNLAKDYSMLIGCVLTWSTLLKIVLIQNWDPSRKLKSKFNEVEFRNLLYDLDIEPGLPSESELLKFIYFTKKYFNNYKCITNIQFANDVYLNLEYLFTSQTHGFVFAEKGSRSDQFIGYVMLDRLEISALELSSKLTQLSNNSTNENELDIHLLNISKENKWREVIYVYNFSKAPLHFQRTVLRSLNGNDDNPAIGPFCISHFHKFVFIIEDTFEKILNSSDISIRPDLYCSSPKQVLYLYPIRYVKNDLPLLMLIEMSMCMDELKYKGTIGFPSILIQYWFTIENWELNDEQLKAEIDEYVTKYIHLNHFQRIKYIKNPVDFRAKLRDNSINKTNNELAKLENENQKTFNDLIKLSSNHKFKKYIQNHPLEPYDIIEIDEILYKPYLYYALRYFNKEKSEWDFDPETIRTFMEKIPANGLSAPADLFAELEIPHSEMSVDSPIASEDKHVNQHKPNKKNHVLLDKLPTPPGATWGQLKINIFNEEWANITYGKVTKPKIHYTKMGFSPGRGKGVNVPPGALWELLKLFGIMPGNEISPSILKSYAQRDDDEALTMKMGTHVHEIYKYGPKTLKTKVSELRGLLKSYFDISGKPITEYDKSGSYKIRFTLSVKF
ncbi:MAG: hypothetical protein GY839_19380 [candidate division Zixibacteria bacterium]|nr:hypothetical protein [candidate division Zixibacteria bacterium]